MRKGKVKWYNETKGFGFIQPEEGGKDIFVHRTGLVNPPAGLQEGQEVTFEIKEGDKGELAVNVQ
ncbi:MAG: cold shock domain-containing protein [Flavobacteriales bacterium]|nr:cold shock domain-containing protein [Flavobacteriales bacterium]